MNSAAARTPASDLSAMFTAQGQAVGQGYAIAKAVVMSAAALEVPHYRIAAEDVDSESQRLLSAMASTRDELRAMVDLFPVDAPPELAPFLTVHSRLRSLLLL